MNNKYKKLVRNVLNNGIDTECRNGIQRILPHYSFIVDFGKESAKLTLRKMYYTGVKGEFETLISPYPLTNVGQFEARGCNYWSEWAGPNGELNLDYHNQLHPQLEDVILQILDDPDSRRHVIDLWDHSNVKNGTLSLACCWYSMVFSIIDNTLNMTWTQRSVDTMVGLPSDIYLAWLFMDYVANKTNLHIGSCMFSLSNVHIYFEHLDNAYVLLGRTENDFDKPLKFKVKV